MLFNSLAKPYKQALVELGDDGVEHILKVMSTYPLRIKIEYFRDAFSMREYANVEMIIVGEGVTNHSKIRVYEKTTWQKFGEMLTKELERMNLDIDVSVRTEHAGRAFLPELRETYAWNQTAISKATAHYFQEQENPHAKLSVRVRDGNTSGKTYQTYTNTTTTANIKPMTKEEILVQIKEWTKVGQ